LSLLVENGATVEQLSSLFLDIGVLEVVRANPETGLQAPGERVIFR